MKSFLKKILRIILGLSIILLVLSISLKEVATSAITSVFAKTEINNKVINIIVSNFPEIDSNTLNSIRNNLDNNAEMKHISNIYLNRILYDIKNNTISDINIKDNIDVIVNQNINRIPLVYQDIIRTRINDIDFQNLYVQLLDYVKSKIPNDTLPIINIVELITNLTTMTLFIISLLLSILLIIILSKPKVEALYDFGMTLLVIGGIMIVILFIIKSMLNYVLAVISTSMNPLSLITFASFGSLIMGMILIDIYERIIDKKSKIKMQKNCI